MLGKNRSVCMSVYVSKYGGISDTAPIFNVEDRPNVEDTEFGVVSLVTRRRLFKMAANLHIFDKMN